MVSESVVNESTDLPPGLADWVSQQRWSREDGPIKPPTAVGAPHLI